MKLRCMFGQAAAAFTLGLFVFCASPAAAEEEAVAQPGTATAPDTSEPAEDSQALARKAYTMGLMMVSHGRYQDAVKRFEEAVRLNPEHYDSYVMLAKVYTRTNQHDKSVKMLEKAIRIEPANPEAYDDLMMLHLYLKKPARAVQVGEKALSAGVSEEALPDLGWSYYQANMPDKAEAVYLRALEREPDAYGPNRNMGILCFSKGEYARARKYYDKATESDPPNSNLPYLKAVNYQMLGMETSAYKCLDELKFRDSKFPNKIGLFNRSYFPHNDDVVSLKDYIYILRMPKPDPVPEGQDGAEVPEEAAE